MNIDPRSARDIRMIRIGVALMREQAAQIIEAKVTDITIDQFTINGGPPLKNSQGHDYFISTRRMSDLLHAKAAEIRAFKPPVTALKDRAG